METGSTRTMTGDEGGMTESGVSDSVRSGAETGGERAREVSCIVTRRTDGTSSQFCLNSVTDLLILGAPSRRKSPNLGEKCPKNPPLLDDGGPVTT